MVGNIGTVLDVGSSVVPPESRMARAIALGRQLGAGGSEPTEAYAALETEFAGMHWVHSLNNTALVAYALEAGGGDFDRSICLTAMGGWDTYSNGATVGGRMDAPTAPPRTAYIEPRLVVRESSAPVTPLRTS